ncbi:MAG: LLM class F420-dependent oxidoreductase [Candidatus Bathyarchaeota archaeon]|nr:LLM class F420-dependent oxidoreductase [Candidatus Bathyarchaeota archaeon]MDH5732416.1 LLM class F420-dependent oxidoreductase [Candidatus Bathyarchaeota archaeon]
MKIGLQIPNFTFPNGPEGFANDIKDIVTTAERAGFYSLWVMDHFFQLGEQGGILLGPVEDDMHEGYSLLNYIAALTRNVKLGTLVTGNIYRPPGILVKTVTTLDVLSGGRAYFGIGAGWFERESVGLGIPYHDWRIRFEMLEETLQIAKQMWSSNNGEFKGNHYKLKETLCSPQPLQRPHPPILIGGMGPRKTLRLVAKYADACSLFTRGGLNSVKNALAILEQHCKDVRRPFDQIEKTTLGPIHLGHSEMPNFVESKRRDGTSYKTSILKTAKDTIEHLNELAKIGIDHAIFNMRYPLDEHRPLEIFQNEIIPAVSDL